MNTENRNGSTDESNSQLAESFAAACNDPAGFDFGFAEERAEANFANFGVSEEQHRGIFETYGVPYPADDEEIVLGGES